MPGTTREEVFLGPIPLFSLLTFTKFSSGNLEKEGNAHFLLVEESCEQPTCS